MKATNQAIVIKTSCGLPLKISKEWLEKFNGNRLIVTDKSCTIEWLPFHPIEEWIIQRIYYFNW